MSLLNNLNILDTNSFMSVNRQSTVNLYGCFEITYRNSFICFCGSSYLERSTHRQRSSRVSLSSTVYSMYTYRRCTFRAIQLNCCFDNPSLKDVYSINAVCLGRSNNWQSMCRSHLIGAIRLRRYSEGPYLYYIDCFNTVCLSRCPNVSNVSDRCRVIDLRGQTNMYCLLNID